MIMENFLVNNPPVGFKLNFLDAYQWRYDSDKKINWHDSFLIDFSLHGKRFVLLKVRPYFCMGYTGDECDKAFVSFEKEFSADRLKKYYPTVIVKELKKHFVKVPSMMVLPKYDRREYFELVESGATHFYRDGCPSSLFEGFLLEGERRKFVWHQLNLFEVSNG